ncbi:MAG: LAGLIDADG family homing endonuclease [Candidatus Heimdallarchaeaceae archaeon]
MNADLAYLVGALRDGSVYHYKKNRSYYTLFYQQHRSWLEESIGERIKRLFGIKYLIDEYKLGHYRLRISNKRLYELWKNEFKFPEEGETQANWLVPKQILQGTIEEKAAFLRGFFDTEGDVSPESSSTFYVGISQKNSTVLLQLRELINELGIRTTIPHIIDQKSQTYRISITGKEEIRKFAEVISSEHPVKCKKIKQMISDD